MFLITLLASKPELCKFLDMWGPQKQWNNSAEHSTLLWMRVFGIRPKIASVSPVAMSSLPTINAVSLNIILCLCLECFPLQFFFSFFIMDQNVDALNCSLLCFLIIMDIAMPHFTKTFLLKCLPATFSWYSKSYIIKSNSWPYIS